MDKKALSRALLSRAASAAATKARFAGKAKQIAGTRNAMNALRGRPSLTLKRGEGMLAAAEKKALGQEARFRSALSAKNPVTPPLRKAAGTYGPGMQKAARVMVFFDELEKIGGVFERLLIGAVERPAVVMGRVLSADDRSKRPNLVNALQEGYPASWVSLGMRPHPGE